MSSKQSKELTSPVKRKFVSPINHGRRSSKSGVNPKFRANLRDFGKFSHQFHNKPKGDQGGGHGKSPFPTHQRRKIQEKRKATHIRYHMGGTIADPLNLNSLIDRDPSFVTPQASPMHCGESPVPILEPQDLTDPLNLKCIPAAAGKDVLITPSKKKKKKKHRNSHPDEENNIEASKEKEDDQHSPKEKKSKRKRKRSRSKSFQGERTIKENQESKTSAENKNLPSQELCEEQQKNSDSGKRKLPDEKSKTDSAVKRVKEEKVETKQETSIIANVPTQGTVACSDKEDIKLNKDRSKHHSYRPKDKLFIYGNYNRYYGYRNPNHTDDPRLKCFRKEWFTDKDVLDIGCNVGHVTLSIARDFKPRNIIGNDIDWNLIKAARNNIRYYIQTPVSGWTKEGVEFPISFALVSGPLAAPVVSKEERKPVFPHNVTFKQENYVLLHEAALKNQLPMYDTILCLSVTKWVHLNWGDEGIKLMFKRIFCNLRPGGILILEPQPFASYKKKKNLTEKIRANYNRIKLKPEKFIDYLLSDDVGFAAFEVLEIPQIKTQGFQRALYLLTKSNKVESHDALGIVHRPSCESQD